MTQEPAEDTVRPVRVLSVAGSDSGGGAGIQADIKTIAAFGGFAMTAITALTAQNTLGVAAIAEVAPAFVAAQMQAVIDDLGVDAIKTGMLHSAPIVEIVAEVIRRKAPGTPLVVDPVMVAKGGARLLDAAAERALIERLLPLATLVTPNIPEAEALTGQPIRDLESMRRAAGVLLLQGRSKAVLLKGGHLPSDRLFDLLLSAEGEQLFESERIATDQTHGTGCTLAAAIATRLGQGWALSDAVASARDYVQRAITAAPGFGQGQGPLNHAVRP